MDEKELMVPLELGYVREAVRTKALHFRVCRNVCHFHDHSRTRSPPLIHSVFLNNCAIFLILQNPGGGEKQESNQWRGGRRVRWPTTPRVARN